MPWQLLGSIIPVVVLLSVLIYFARRKDKRNEELYSDSGKCLEVGAKCANELHKKKYGKPSVDLENAFPALKAVE